MFYLIQGHTCPSMQLPMYAMHFSVVQTLAKEDIQLAARPARPGRLGQAVKVVSNFYKANFSQAVPLMHHDIRVEKMRYNAETCLLYTSDAADE